MLLWIPFGSVAYCSGAIKKLGLNYFLFHVVNSPLKQYIHVDKENANISGISAAEYLVPLVQIFNLFMMSAPV